MWFSKPEKAPASAAAVSVSLPPADMSKVAEFPDPLPAPLNALHQERVTDPDRDSARLAARPDGHFAAHASLKGRGSARRHPGLFDADEADNLANSEHAQRRASLLARVEKNIRKVVCPVGFEPTTR